MVGCARGATGGMEGITDRGRRLLEGGLVQDAIDGLDVAFHGGRDLARIGRNLAHFQCARQGAEQSTTNRTNHVIESGRNLLVRFDTVEFFDSTMNTESDRMLKSFKMHFSDRALDSINSHPTGMHNL